MLKAKEIGDIALILWYLPLAKVEEIKKQVLALKQHCGFKEPIDDSDEWTRQDEMEFSKSTLRRLEEENPWPEDSSYGKESTDAKAG